jgi:hypothetical protein
MKDEMGRAYSTHGWLESQKERDHWENLNIDGRTALGWRLVK